jgi:hypothetical protein
LNLGNEKPAAAEIAEDLDDSEVPSELDEQEEDEDAESLDSE